MSRTAIVTHVDLDGVGAATAYTILQGLPLERIEIVFTVPRKLPQVLRDIMSKRNLDTIVIMDLGVNRDTFNDIISILRQCEPAKRVLWFDHHVWEDEWMNEISKFVRLYLDRSTCAAGVVFKYVERVESDNEVIDELRDFIDMVCGVDLWKFHRWECNYLYRYVSYMASNNRLEEAFRELVEVLRSKRLYDFIHNECNRIAELVVSRELEVINKVLSNVDVLEIGGSRICVYVKDRRDVEVSSSLIGNVLVHRGLCDIAAIVRRDMNTVSLRSYVCDVRSIAVSLGGGGHPRAAGAQLELPSIQRFFLRILNELGAKRSVVRTLKSVLISKLSPEVVRQSCAHT